MLSRFADLSGARSIFVAVAGPQPRPSRSVSCSAAVTSSLRMPRMAWTWSTTTVAWPSGATSALASPRRGSSAAVPTWASQSRGRA